MVKNRKVKVAVIGCGRVAWLGFLPWIKRRKDTELCAVVDVDEELLGKTAKKFEARRKYTDWREALDESGADAVCVLTPPWLHAELVIEAAARGMHVLCEKPMASSVEDCRRMLEACEDAGVMLQIGFSLRFDPGYEKLKEIVKTGGIGEVFQMRSEYDVWVPDLNSSPFKEIVDLGGKLRVLGTPDMGAWRMTDERAGGGVYFDHGIHYTDLFSWILDDDVKTVFGAIRHVVPGRIHEDHASAYLRFGCGTPAYIEASLARWSARSEIDEGLINGSAGCLRYELDQSWYLRGYPHLYFTHARVWKFGRASLALGSWLPVRVESGPRVVMFRRQMDYFISRINGTFEPHPVFGDRWGADGRDGMNAIRVACALYESSEKGCSVDL